MSWDSLKTEKISFALGKESFHSGKSLIADITCPGMTASAGDSFNINFLFCLIQIGFSSTCTQSNGFFDIDIYILNRV